MATYDDWKLATPPEYANGDDLPPTREDELADYLDSLGLDNIANAPKDGSEFTAFLVETGERVTAFYSDQHRHWLSEDWWCDANGDGAPDGGQRQWTADEFAGWLPSSQQKAA